MNTLEIKTMPFNRYSIDSLYGKSYSDYPVVYFLNNNTLAYIGETVAVRSRMRNHLNNPERKSLDKMTLIIHEKFNRSATYNIETKLINYFLADERYKLQNKSQTSDSISHNYYDKPFFNEELFNELWDQLKERDYVTHSREVIENKDIFKLSPFKELSMDQIELKVKIIDVCEKHINDDKPFVFLVKGEAGTGKSVVLSAVFNRIQELAKEKSSALYNSNNFLLVNHTEMLKTYHKIAGKVKALKKNNFDKPTPFINKRKKSNQKADIVFVDEAHLLLTRPDSFNNFKENNHLEEIMKHSKIVILVFDDKQVLKMKSYWDENKLLSLVDSRHSEEYILKNQFRMRASHKMISWIDHFVGKKITPIPQKEEFDFQIFDSAAKMYKEICEKNEKFGLARMVSTFDYVHKKDGETYYIKEDQFKLPWNTTEGDATWAEREDTIREVGSIYTIQGFDLNYVGVILGPSVAYDEENDELKIITENYKDTEAFRGKDEFDNPHYIKEKIILNSINVLLKRGIKGLYIFASDLELRARLLELYPNRTEDYRNMKIAEEKSDYR
ncbi:DUF2075 domain-containing protein [Peribacillus asahii]|uniref:DUF2075 domain-containing protein n=1 Tax=Peribacillus asahii TaxID=228899 RepID=UPI00207AC6D5|nr:DUF2075 domain-containing protein [Peribacillus asahii]USK58246.1 DUF2075 domain-containing protein [Peribacillus asahii]